MSSQRCPPCLSFVGQELQKPMPESLKKKLKIVSPEYLKPFKT